MKKISLTNTEFTQLREVYKVELKKAYERVEHLSAILAKLDEEKEVAEEKSEAKIIKLPKAKTTKAKTKLVPKPKVAAKPNAVQQEKKTKSTVKAKVTRGRKPSALKQRVKKQIGSKTYKWNDFVLETIKDNGAPMLTLNIAESAMSKLKTKESEKAKVKSAISATLSKLVTTDKMLGTHKIEGSRQKLYGLPEWFDSKGNLLPEFMPKA